MEKTIVAITTPYGNGAVCIVKLSGREAFSIACRLFECKNFDFKNALPNTLYLGTFSHKNFKDNCLCVYFKSPKSFTGEDVVEFQCHGGVLIAEKILQACLENGCLLADKGEFTKLAFLNGKVSLADAEGIVDMINAESDAQLKAGYELLKGSLSQKINDILDVILDVVANFEASLDYPEEMEDEAKINGYKELVFVENELNKLLLTAFSGSLIKNGINVAIIGLPNTGKSSLLNNLLKKERAIVTDIAGTTRDTLEEKFELDGFLINLIDTAGIRETDNIVENIGVKKAEEKARDADIILAIFDASKEFSDQDKDLLNKYSDKKIIKVLNKTDLSESEKNTFFNDDSFVKISVKNNFNIDILKEKIKEELKLSNIDTSGIIITNKRHEESIKNCLESVKSARESIGIMPNECVLIDIKNAYSTLAEIVGKNASEEIIDKIFSTFCLGK